MFLFLSALYQWLPFPLLVVAVGVLFIFGVIVVLRLVALILDVIPFL